MNTVKAIQILSKNHAGAVNPPAPLAMLFTTLFYIFTVVSVPLDKPQIIVCLAIYPVVVSEIYNKGFFSLFLNSLYVLPFIVLIGILNPIYNSRVAFNIGNIGVSEGMVSFVSIVLRGLLTMQAALLLIQTTGFYQICNLLVKIRLPKIFVTQLLLTYRFIFLLLEEAETMNQARKARGYGKKSYSLKLWSVFVGQLLIRSSERASRVHKAMLARGFNGTFPVNYQKIDSNMHSVLFTVISCSAILIIRSLHI